MTPSQQLAGGYKTPNYDHDTSHTNYMNTRKRFLTVPSSHPTPSSAGGGPSPNRLRVFTPEHRKNDPPTISSTLNENEEDTLDEPSPKAFELNLVPVFEEEEEEKSSGNGMVDRCHSFSPNPNPLGIPKMDNKFQTSLPIFPGRRDKKKKEKKKQKQTNEMGPPTTTTLKLRIQASASVVQGLSTPLATFGLESLDTTEEDIRASYSPQLLLPNLEVIMADKVEDEAFEQRAPMQTGGAKTKRSTSLLVHPPGYHSHRRQDTMIIKRSVTERSPNMAHILFLLKKTEYYLNFFDFTRCVSKEHSPTLTFFSAN